MSEGEMEQEGGRGGTEIQLRERVGVFAPGDINDI